jgi:hypothetical protein
MVMKGKLDDAARGDKEKEISAETTDTKQQHFRQTTSPLTIWLLSHQYNHAFTYPECVKSRFNDSLHNFPALTLEEAFCNTVNDFNVLRSSCAIECHAGY